MKLENFIENSIIDSFNKNRFDGKSKFNTSFIDKSNRIVKDAPGIETAGIVIIPVFLKSFPQ